MSLIFNKMGFYLYNILNYNTLNKYTQCHQILSPERLL